MSERDRGPLVEALNHLAIWQRHRDEGDLGTLIVRDAIRMRLAAAIEGLSKRDKKRRKEPFGNTWAFMWATRNRIAHAYALVNFEVIAATIDQDAPQMVATLSKALDDP